LSVHSGRNSEANKVVRTDASGHLQAGYINSLDGYNNYNDSIPSRIWGSEAGSDYYLRTYNPAQMQSRFQSQSHIGTYYLRNNWDGTYWLIDSNHPSGVRVKRADSAANITDYSINQNLSSTSNPTFGTVYTGNWFRSNGNTGWYNETHAGGIHMTDATYVRTYGGKQFYCDSNILAGGNVTAYSDERLKKDWSTFGPDMLERLSEVKSGTYTRIDSGIKQVGVSAQSLQKVMPDAVCEGENGHLTVAYGNAALSACVELAKEVVTLRKRIEVLSSIVDKKQNPELTSNATVTKSTEDK
jgi:hypothetical protein